MNTQKRYIEDRIDELEREVAQLKEENISLKTKLDFQIKLIAQFNERLKEINKFNERLREAFKDGQKNSNIYDADFSKIPFSAKPNYPTRNNAGIVKPAPTNPQSPTSLAKNTSSYERDEDKNATLPKNISTSFDFSKEPFIEDFNRLSELSGRDFTDARKFFLKENTAEALSCENVEARMNNPNLPPVYVEISPVQRGDFWAIPVRENTFAVLPNPQNSYNDNLHWERAMGKVFDSNFKPNNTYDKIQVERPALFERIGNKWIFREKGRLFLE